MSDIHAELRSFLAALRARPDIVVEIADLGDPASDAALAFLDADAPDDVRRFFAGMDGLHLEWRFVEPEGGGCVRIPRLSQWSRFAADQEHHTSFGDDHEIMFLDELQPEAASFLVRRKGERAARVLFGRRASDAIEVATSIEGYLRAGMRMGFAAWWPACGGHEDNVTYCAEEAAVRRFQASPRPPRPLLPGARVHATSFSAGARGVLEQLQAVPAESRHRQLLGPHVARVLLDDGTRVWLGSRYLRVVGQSDAYEHARAALPPGSDPQPTLALLARATAPLTGYVGEWPSTVRLWAGVLADHSPDAVIAWAAELYEATIAARVSFTAPMPFAAVGDELAPTAWTRHRWALRVRDLFEGALAGVHLLTRRRSASLGVPPGQLVAPGARATLSRIGLASALCDALDSAVPLAPVQWSWPDGSALARELGLPDDTPLLAGSGY